MKRKRSTLVRVSDEFKEIIEQMREETARKLGIEKERITIPLVTSILAKKIKKEKNNLNKKIEKFLDDLTT